MNKETTITLYKITFATFHNAQRGNLLRSAIRASWLNIIQKDGHYQFPKQTKGLEALFVFVPYNKRVRISPNKFYWVTVQPMDISTRGMNIDFIFSEDNTPQAFMEKITAIFAENRVDEDVIFATPNKETFLAILRQLPIFIEENFNDKTQVVQEAKECYYNKFINRIIENI